MNQHPEASTSLQYFIAEKNSVIIVSWIGQFVHETIQTIEACQTDLLKAQAKWVIFNCRDLKPNMDRSAIPILAKLQKTIREKPAVLKMTSMHPELRSYLDSQGLIRPEEIALNLTDAIRTAFRPK
jgi:anti-anti-sigma regulatory factor